MDKKYLYFGVISAAVVVLAAIVAVSVIPHEPAVPVVYIVYPSEKGDLSYTDSAYQGLVAAQKEISFTIKEFTPRESDTLSRGDAGRALLGEKRGRGWNAEGDNPLSPLTASLMFRDPADAEPGIPSPQQTPASAWILKNYRELSGFS